MNETGFAHMLNAFNGAFDITQFCALCRTGQSMFADKQYDTQCKARSTIGSVSFSITLHRMSRSKRSIQKGKITRCLIVSA